MVGTDLGAFATTDAGIRRLEIAGCDEEAVEEGTDDVALCPFQRTWEGVNDADLTGLQCLDDVGHTLTGILTFPYFLRWGVDIETWQTDIGLGHLNSPCRGAGPATSLHVFAEYLVGHACVVATGRHHVQIADILDAQPCDELFHKRRDTPSVSGKDETKAFVGLQSVGFLFQYRIGDEDEWVVQGFRNLFGHPSRVAYPAKIKYHSQLFNHELHEDIFINRILGFIGLLLTRKKSL